MAKIFTIIFWVVTTIDFYDSIPSPLKYIFCIIPNLALNFAFKVIFQFERSGRNFLLLLNVSIEIGSISFVFKGKHLDITTLFTNLYGDSLNLGAILIFMLFWSAIYVPLIWYFEKILPGQFGVPLPFYFVFMPSYWIESYRSHRDRIHSSSRQKYSSLDRLFFQPEPTDLPTTVRLKHISKVKTDL